MITTPKDLIKPDVELIGMDGNAMVIIGNVRRELRRVGNTREVVDRFAEEAMSGDYDHVLATALAYTNQDEE